MASTRTNVDTTNPAYRHGHAGKGKFSPEYHSWAGMIQRCTNPKRSSFKHYGERGITVCKRWLKFENFLADMGPRPEGLTLERKNNDKGYNKRNCEWATQSRQNRNSRQTKMVTIEGKTRALSDWCDVYKISINTVRCRVKTHGWSYIKAITTPRQTRSDRGYRGRFGAR